MSMLQKRMIKRSIFLDWFDADFEFPRRSFRHTKMQFVVVISSVITFRRRVEGNRFRICRETATSLLTRPICIRVYTRVRERK